MTDGPPQDATGGQGAPAGDATSKDDADWFDEFMGRFEGMEQKLSRIPDDIGSKLDEIAGKINAKGAAEPSTAPGGGASQGPSQPTPPAYRPPARIPETPKQPDSKQKSSHWYFGERWGKRGG